jgi:hypothetical protein
MTFWSLEEDQPKHGRMIFSERMNAQCTLAVQRRLDRENEALLAVIRTNRDDRRRNRRIRRDRSFLRVQNLRE